MSVELIERRIDQNNLVDEMSDRCVLFDSWGLFFPDSKLFNLIASVLNDSPIMLDTNLATVSSRSTIFVLKMRGGSMLAC